MLVVFPTLWDFRQISAAEPVEYTTPDDADCPDDFDVLGFIDTTAARIGPEAASGCAGVLSSSDYPGAVVAAAIAMQTGHVGADPAAVLRCGNKYAARLAMCVVIAEATPRFALVQPPTASHGVRWSLPADDPARPRFPLFVKPVKGAFSAHTALVHDAAELEAFLGQPSIADYTRNFLRLHHRLQARYAPDLPDASAFIVEEILHGDQVTVEGFTDRGSVHLLGVVDSIFHPGIRSFARFEYPSKLPTAVQVRMHDIARRAIAALGLDGTLFNVEMIYDAVTDRIGVLEVNPRMCGQFADLYEKVDGTNGYAVALALARGESPLVRHGAGTCAVTASVPLRVFAPTHVQRAPSASDIAAAEALYPGTRVWVECATGDALCDFDSIEDGSSARYAVVNVGAPGATSLTERVDAVVARLAFELVPSTRQVSPNS